MVVGVVLHKAHVRIISNGGVPRLLGAEDHALAGLVLGNEVVERKTGVRAVLGMVVVVIEARAVGKHGVGKEFLSGKLLALSVAVAQVVWVLVEAVDA